MSIKKILPLKKYYVSNDFNNMINELQSEKIVLAVLRHELTVLIDLVSTSMYYEQIIIKYICRDDNLSLLIDLISCCKNFTFHSGIYFKTALTYDSYNIATYFVQNGFVDITSDDNYAIKCVAGSINKDSTAFLKLLIENGADIGANNNYPLQATANGLLDNMQLLINYGADIHVNDEYVLQTACHSNNINMVELLLDTGANVHIYNLQIIKDAVKNNNIKLVQLLIKYGANIFDIGYDEMITIVGHGHTQMVQYLIENGVDFSIINNYTTKTNHSLDTFKMVQQLSNQNVDPLVVCQIISDTNINY